MNHLSIKLTDKITTRNGYDDSHTKSKIHVENFNLEHLSMRHEFSTAAASSGVIHHLQEQVLIENEVNWNK